jgi:hypothetical protein
VGHFTRGSKILRLTKDAHEKLARACTLST